MTEPKYPIYIPSKGRADVCMTADALNKDAVPFRLVVESQERAAYAARYGEDCILVLPFCDRGLFMARRWIMEHSIAEGHARHWQLDDNMAGWVRMYRGKKIPVDAGIALRVVEDFSDRYENVAIAGHNYRFFHASAIPPFFRNVHVYSSTLINNEIPYRWRTLYNDDTDMCLQALAGGWCTILVNAFLVNKKRTMTVKGGNTDELYQDDGRLRMARSLERLWPHVVTTTRKYGRPQHHIHDSWRRFDTPLILRSDVQLEEQPNEYGMTLVQKSEIKSAHLRDLVGDRL